MRVRTLSAFICSLTFLVIRRLTSARRRDRWRCRRRQSAEHLQNPDGREHPDAGDPHGPGHGSQPQHHLQGAGLRKDRHRRGRALSARPGGHDPQRAGEPRHRRKSRGHRRRQRRRRHGVHPRGRARRQARAARSGLDGPLRQRSGGRADVGAGGGPADHLGRQRDHRPALHLRRRPRVVHLPGYDCSGTVSFALHGASLLSTPEDSSEFEAWGSHGAGRWVAIFSNPGHAYMTVAGLRLDTSAAETLQPAGSALAPAAPGQLRLTWCATRSASERLTARPSATLEAGGRSPIGRPEEQAIGGSDGRPDRAHVNRREGEGLETAGPGRRPRRDARLQLPEAGRTAAERQEGHRRRGHRQEAPADAGDLAAAERRQARHAGAPGGVRRPARTSRGRRSSARTSPRPSCSRSTRRSPNSKSSSRS